MYVLLKFIGCHFFYLKMLSQLKHLDPVKDEEEIKKKASVPLEHIFGCHKYCGDWCYKKGNEKRR